MQKQLHHPHHEPDATSLPTTAVWGTFYGALSAVAYTAANIGLRSVTDCDPVWVSCVKAVPTLIGTAPWLWMAWRSGAQVFPSASVMWNLVWAAMFGHLAGNVVFQWSLGVIGIALTVPICMGTIIIGSAILGRALLNESITARACTALAILVAAIWMLQLGAESASASVRQLQQASSLLVMLGVAGACLSGIAYAALGVAIRHAVMRKSTVAATTFSIASIGFLLLTTIVLSRQGVEVVRETSRTDWSWMLFAGISNLIAFVALTRALQIATLVYVNALNASQVAMASLAGLVFFQERLSPAIGWGIALTVLGLLLMPAKRRSPPQPSE